MGLLVVPFRVRHRVYVYSQPQEAHAARYSAGSVQDLQKDLSGQEPCQEVRQIVLERSINLSLQKYSLSTARSLQDGLAFCALIATIDPSLLDFNALKKVADWPANSPTHSLAIICALSTLSDERPC